MRSGNLLAEKYTGDIGYLVRFVKYDGVHGGQQFGNAFFAQHHVGKKQVVIDHNDVGGLRVLACLHDEAFLVVRAIRAEAIFTG